MNKFKKSFIVFTIVLFFISGLFVPIKTAKAFSLADFFTGAWILGGLDPITGLLIDASSCWINLVFDCPQYAGETYVTINKTTYEPGEQIVAVWSVAVDSSYPGAVSMWGGTSGNADQVFISRSGGGSFSGTAYFIAPNVPGPYTFHYTFAIENGEPQNRRSGSIPYTVVVPPSCTGTVPTHATAYTNNTAPTSDTAYTYGTSAGVCKYYCNTNFDWDGSNCTPVIDGACSSPHYTCSKGTGDNQGNVNGFDTASQYLWNCIGSGGGTNAACSEDKPNQTNTLNISKAGTGTGTVAAGTISGHSITCSPTCSASYASGTQVTLTEIPSVGSSFSGWSGACTNTTGPCTITMDENKNVIATFTENPPSTNWTNYCTGTDAGASPPHPWQIWKYDNSSPVNYQFVENGTAANGCVAGNSPTVSISDNPSRNTCPDETFSISWSSSHVTSCTVTSTGVYPYSIPPALNGTYTPGYNSFGMDVYRQGNYTFTANCKNAAGETVATDSVTHTVVACLAPTGTLSLSPASCVIAKGASTCSTVYATWTTARTTDPKLVDGNVGTTLSTLANKASPGLQVWVAYPQTVFNLKNGSTVLDTKTATATCASGSSWNGSICATTTLPTVSISDDPSRNTCPDETFSISWSSSLVNSCTITSTGVYSYSIPPALNGTYTTFKNSPFGIRTYRLGDYIFTASCKNASGETVVTDSITHSVVVCLPTVNGVCSATQTETCEDGKYSNSPDDTVDYYKWTCLGSGSPVGTDSDTCTAAKSTVAPDLTAGSVSPTSAHVNAVTPLSAQITNIGNATTGAGFTDSFQINPDSIPATFSDIQTIRTYSSSSLASGGSNTASASYTFSSAGTWYVRACADLGASNTGTIAESDEGNNCGASWTAITVSDSPPPPPPCVSYQGSTCYSSGNSCEQVGSGAYRCNGTCSAVTPPDSNCPPPPPAATISANPARVRSTPPDNKSLITWTITNATCSITKNGTTWKSGLTTTSSASDTITAQTVYTITCTSVTPQSVTVNIIPVFQEF